MPRMMIIINHDAVLSADSRRFVTLGLAVRDGRSRKVDGKYQMGTQIPAIAGLILLQLAAL